MRYVQPFAHSIVNPYFGAPANFRHIMQDQFFAATSFAALCQKTDISFAFYRHAGFSAKTKWQKYVEQNQTLESKFIIMIFAKTVQVACYNIAFT